MRVKARNIVVVVDVFQWILGKMGRAIADSLPDDRVRLVPHWQLRSRSDEAARLLAEADIVHFICSYAYQELRGWPVLAERAVVGTLHHEDESMAGLVEDLVAADAIMVTSRQWRQIMIDTVADELQVAQVDYGIESEVFRPAADRAGLRRRWGIGEEVFTFGFFAKKSPTNDRKGADVFVAAVHELAKMRKDFQVLIVGPGWQQVRAELEGQGISVSYFPFLARRRMPEAYQLLDVYVCASRIEGGPCPVLEALSSAVPVVSTPVGVVEEVITNGGTGFIVPQESPSEIANRLLQIMEDRDLQIAMGKAGRQLIEQKYRWELIGPPMKALYDLAEARFAERTGGERTIRYAWDQSRVDEENAQAAHQDAIRFAAAQFQHGNYRSGLNIGWEWLTSGPQTLFRRLWALPLGFARVAEARARR